MIHVGDFVKSLKDTKDKSYLKRKVFLEKEEKFFLKHHIINADSQMESIKREGISIDYGYLTNRKSIFSLIKSGFEIRNLCIKKNIDILHAFWGSTTGLISVMFSPCPVIISFSGSDLIGTRNLSGRFTLGGIFNKIVSNLVSRMTAANITKSKEMKFILPKSAQYKTKVIPNGVNLKKFYPIKNNIAKKKLGLENGIDYILFFYTEGQHVKNNKMAMEVFKLIKDTKPNTEIIIATDIAHEDLIYYYNSCSVMIITSFHEGSNNSVKEAIACDLPIVTVNVGDVEERLENKRHCYVTNSYDILLFSNKVLNVLKSKERSDGSKNMGRINESTVALDIVKLYRKIYNN